MIGRIGQLQTRCSHLETPAHVSATPFAIGLAASLERAAPLSDTLRNRHSAQQEMFMQLRHSLCSVGALGALCVLLASCAPMASKIPVAQLKDGELAVPADYKSWPKFLSAIQRPDAKQVREIYMNTAAKSGTAAAGFPQGTVFVMENYAARANPDGTLQMGSDGKLVKGDLLRVFVMGKNEGWGLSAPEGLKNGDWVYAAYLPSGEKSADPITACRACHLPLSNKDFVHRYDEYFSRPGAALPARLNGTDRVVMAMR